jgi:GAG-pre-integrase domain
VTTTINDKDLTEQQRWHQRLGHPGKLRFKNTLKTLGISYDSKNENEHNQMCTACQNGKYTQLPFKSTKNETTHPGELIVFDVFGPLNCESLDNIRYALVIRDDYSKYTKSYPIAEKHSDGIHELVTQFIMWVERQSGSKCKRIRSDQAPEYRTVAKWATEKGIEVQKALKYTSQQNGRAERAIRTIMDITRTLLADAHIPLFYWPEITKTAAHLYNRLIGEKEKTPLMLLRGNDKPHNLQYLKRIGAECQVMVVSSKKVSNKLEKRTEVANLLGYGEGTKAYRVLLKNSGKIIESREVVFNEPTISV